MAGISTRSFIPAKTQKGEKTLLLAVTLASPCCLYISTTRVSPQGMYAGNQARRKSKGWRNLKGIVQDYVKCQLARRLCIPLVQPHLQYLDIKEFLIPKKSGFTKCVENIVLIVIEHRIGFGWSEISLFLKFELWNKKKIKSVVKS